MWEAEKFETVLSAGLVDPVRDNRILVKLIRFDQILV